MRMLLMMDSSIFRRTMMRMERMNKKSPMRMCVGCHEMQEKREMIRVLKTQDNTFCIDAAGRKNGRGAYLCKKMECLESGSPESRIGTFIQNEYTKRNYCGT